MKFSKITLLAPLLLLVSCISAAALPSGILPRDVSHYTVKAGDTGLSIAQANGVSFQALSTANPNVNWNNLQIGTSLTVPASSGSGSSSKAVAAGASSSSSSGPCEGAGNACTGDVTHWDGGMGACGWNVNTASDMQVSLPVGIMGSQSNGNPYCGRSVTIEALGGQLVKAKVGDKCMGCSGDSIDLTDALFNAVAPGGDGRVHGVKWYFQ